MNNKKTVVSFSGGKDSCLSIYRALSLGYESASLITTYDKGGDRSWFHGIPKNLLERVSESIGIPICFMETSIVDDYSKAFEEMLAFFKSQSISFCVFGDIDIVDHLKWCQDRCKAVSVEAVFPLWQENRESLVKEFINVGFKAIITLVNRDFLPDIFLGRELSLDLLDEIKLFGADVCGENGEYHTFVFDGPIFSRPVDFNIGNVIEIGKYSALPITDNIV